MFDMRETKMMCVILKR